MDVSKKSGGMNVSRRRTFSFLLIASGIESLMDTMDTMDADCDGANGKSERYTKR